MANEMVPMPGDRPSGDHDGSATEKPQDVRNGKHQVFDPLVAVGYVDTDEGTAGVEWNLPPTDDEPWQGYEAARSARRAAQRADEDAEHARRHGQSGYAALRESDAGENRQMGWADWGDARTWAIIAAMFFGFLLFVAFVYFTPTGRHNQTDGPMSVPPYRGY